MIDFSADINDISFADYTDGYWEAYENTDKRCPKGLPDPDTRCGLLRDFHSFIWSRILPNGQKMKLTFCKQMSDYLSWNGMRFGSDSIIASFRYLNNMELINKVSESMDDFERWIKEYSHVSNTLGGFIILPKHRNSINQLRGTNPLIKDRWDLTLECIKRYYDGVVSLNDNPLARYINEDRAFFELFIDFKGFIDFFLLNDWVDDDYTVRYIIPTIPFKDSPLPHSIEEYVYWIENMMDLVKNRNNRINLMLRSMK